MSSVASRVVVGKRTIVVEGEVALGLAKASLSDV